MLKTLSLYGQEIDQYCDQLGQLRIEVFKDWPYLYKGDISYERTYLKRYAQSKNSFVLLVFDQSELVGATTALLLVDETESIQKPLLDLNQALDSIVYFGESLLLSQYRGQGLGKLFMNARLDFANSISQVTHAVFCSVVRPHDHPLKPKDYRPLDDFWRNFGFQEQNHLQTQLEWLDQGESRPTKKTLKYWLKSLT